LGDLEIVKKLVHWRFFFELGLAVLGLLLAIPLVVLYQVSKLKGRALTAVVAIGGVNDAAERVR